MKTTNYLKAAFGGLFFLGYMAVTAQETPPSTLPAVTLGENVTMKIGGFLRADMFYDTRLSDELVDGMFNFHPLNEKLIGGKDMNDVSQFRMSGTASRLNSRFTGPDVLNAKTSSLIEFDFTGVNGYGLRLRHAWVKLNWEKSELLFGRFWHPMFILEAFPSVVALSTGAPFAVFNRCEQLRYTMNFGQLSFFGAASAQMKYGFPAVLQPDSSKAPGQYQSMPDLTANIQFKNDILILGASAQLKSNQPQNVFLITKTNRIVTNESVTSIAGLAYVQLKFGDLKIKTSALYGQNMHEVLMLGGYAIKSINGDGVAEYTTMNTMNIWGNIIYGKAIQASVFVGYLKNLGAGEKTILGIPFGRGSDIDNVIRIAPCFSYKSGRLLFQTEVEHNIAAFGTPDAADSYKVKNTKSFSNTRILIATTYFF